jgi:hypothetical protein
MAGAGCALTNACPMCMHMVYRTMVVDRSYRVKLDGYFDPGPRSPSWKTRYTRYKAKYPVARDDEQRGLDGNRVAVTFFY